MGHSPRLFAISFSSGTARRPLGCILALGAVLGLLATPLAARAEDPARLDSFRAELRSLIEAARNQVFPALVNIQLVTSIYAGGKEIKGRAVGSGTIIDAQGHVLTNQHVTNQGRRFRCTLIDKSEISAELVGEDPLTDLAVLRLNLAELPAGHAPLPVASLGDSDRLEVGDFVMAMGSPLALSRSVTLGIVSNTERVFADGLADSDDDMQLAPGQRTGLFTRWIQHDALINPGNSGGPLVNLQGQVIGVNELGGAAIGFAIPANLAREVAQALIAHGQVPRSWLGLSFRPIQKTGLERGVLIDSVIGDSPAGRAGLRPGDVLWELAGQPVTVRFAEEAPVLMKRVADLPIGGEVLVKFDRGGTPQEATVTTAKLERDRGEERELRKWGLTALEITPWSALERRLPSTEGVLVSGVRGGGPAASAKPPLGDEDVIRALDGQPIKSLSELVARYEAYVAAARPAEGAADQPAAEAPPIVVEFERQGELYLTLLEPGKGDDDENPPPAVPKAWLGISVQPVLRALAQRLGTGTPLGFRITRVYPETTAATADLAVGDVVTALNGKKLEPRRAEDAGLLQRELQKLDLDARVKLTLFRGGESREVEVSVEPTRTRPDEARRATNKDFELAVRELTFFDRVERRWDSSTRGVLVQHAESAGWAGLGGLAPGDLIQKVNDREVASLADFRRVLAETSAERPRRVVFAVLRGVRTRFLYVEPEWDPAPTTAESPGN